MRWDFHFFGQFSVGFKPGAGSGEILRVAQNETLKKVVRNIVLASKSD
jgi:hypothetical protein